MFVTNWNSTTKIQKISEITNFFRHYFLSRTEVTYGPGKPGKHHKHHKHDKKWKYDKKKWKHDRDWDDDDDD